MSHPPITGRPVTRAARGMVASPYHLASQAGIAALRRGGSAVDAVIALNAVIAVGYPHMGGLGGDGFWIIATPDGEVLGLNASGPSAAAATRERYARLAPDGRIPARGGAAALTVPGAIDGWREAHERFGKLPWRDLFDDARTLAADGVPVTRGLARWLAADAELLAGDPEAAATFLPDGEPLGEGAGLVQPALARTLETLAEGGARDAFYEGPIGRALCEGIAAKGSPLAVEDLASYRAEWVRPVSTTYRGVTAYELPPNTQGIAALQALNLLEGYDLASWGDGSADHIHVAAEAAKVASADRDAWVSDPRFVEAPLELLLSKSYAERRRRLVDRFRARPLGGIEPGVPYHRGDTCAFSAWDAEGLAVSAIQSLAYDFGAGVIAGETGVIMQNRGTYFSLREDAANRLEPRKRTMHTLIPALLARDGMPWVVYGTQGGEGQPQTHAAIVVRLVDFGYDVQQALEAPRWVMGRTWGDIPASQLALESRIAADVAEELAHRGHDVRIVGPWETIMGQAQAIRRDPETGFFEGGADPRGDGAAVGL